MGRRSASAHELERSFAGDVLLAPLRSRAGARLSGVRFPASTGNRDRRKFHRKRAATDIAQDQPCRFHGERHQTSTGMTEPDQQQTFVVTGPSNASCESTDSRLTSFQSTLVDSLESGSLAQFGEESVECS